MFPNKANLILTLALVLNRDFRAGDVFEQDIGGQGITAVTISDTGTCIFLVEVYEDDRLR